ncbi:MAG: urate hydroxylase PuuD [Pseudomonadota bacterium]
MVDLAILDWLTFLLRWVHVITAIAWIGASFYFVWLDRSLRQPSDLSRGRGIQGELSAIHGGGIYLVGKYASHPKPMPAELHWFKWEAYSTWLSGSVLMVFVYYLNADSYLLGSDTWFSTAAPAIAFSIGYLLLALVLYELLCRVALPVPGMAVVASAALLLLSWLAFQAFAPRAAIIHFGAALATMMAANVFMVIIPSQKAFIAAIDAGEVADINLAQKAKIRSTHNNYFTLPVLFCMLSNHAPFVFGHAYAWLFVVALSVVAAWARHYFNVKHTGVNKPSILVSAVVAWLLLIFVFAATQQQKVFAYTPQRAQVQEIVTQHCANCHSREPRFPGFQAAPGGFEFERPEQLLRHRDVVRTSVQTHYMPLGNQTGMTDAERDLLLAFVQTDGPARVPVDATATPSD